MCSENVVSTVGRDAAAVADVTRSKPKTSHICIDGLLMMSSKLNNMLVYTADITINRCHMRNESYNMCMAKGSLNRLNMINMYGNNVLFAWFVNTVAINSQRMLHTYLALYNIQ